MSEQNDQQAVVEKTNAGAQPPAEGADARDKGDDLDTLLNEYDNSTQKTEPESTPDKPKGAASDPNVSEELKALRADMARMASKTDMEATIKAIRGELDPEVFDDDFVEAWVDAQARKDPRLSRAWQERHNNPKQFEKVKAELGKGFASRFKKLPDAGATEDHEAVAAAVRGSSGKAPEGKAPDFSKMNNHEFREAHFKEYGYYPDV